MKAASSISAMIVPERRPFPGKTGNAVQRAGAEQENMNAGISASGNCIPCMKALY